MHLVGMKLVSCVYLIFLGVITVLESLSPVIIYIHPPEKFYNEIRASGGYSLPDYQRNEELALQPTFNGINPLFHFNDVYFRTTTTMLDIGHHQIHFSSRIKGTSRLITTLHEFYVLEQGMKLIQVLSA